MKIYIRNFLFLFTVVIGSLIGSANAAVTYVHTDHLGSVVAESNASGQITKRFHYKPFGESIEAQHDDIGYTGHKHDTDLGLTYMQARYYDPVLGRFYGNDPVGYTGEVDTFNRYSYVANNPYRYIDPTGETKYKGDKSGSAVTFLLASAIAKYSEPGSDTQQWAQRVANLTNPVEGGGRSASKNRNKVEPVAGAEGPHSSWKVDPKTGEITRTETYMPNPQNPSGFDTVKTVDLTGKPHRNKKTGEAVPTPHVQGKEDNGDAIPGGVRPATPEEIPKPSTPEAPKGCVTNQDACG